MQYLLAILQVWLTDLQKDGLSEIGVESYPHLKIYTHLTNQPMEDRKP